MQLSRRHGSATQADSPLCRPTSGSLHLTTHHAIFEADKSTGTSDQEDVAARGKGTKSEHEVWVSWGNAVVISLDCLWRLTCRSRTDPARTPALSHSNAAVADGRPFADSPAHSPLRVVRIGLRFPRRRRQRLGHSQGLVLEFCLGRAREPLRLLLRRCQTRRQEGQRKSWLGHLRSSGRVCADGSRNEEQSLANNDLECRLSGAKVLLVGERAPRRSVLTSCLLAAVLPILPRRHCRPSQDL